jgi:hypothetical protein
MRRDGHVELICLDGEAGVSEGHRIGGFDRVVAERGRPIQLGDDGGAILDDAAHEDADLHRVERAPIDDDQIQRARNTDGDDFERGYRKAVYRRQ